VEELMQTKGPPPAAPLQSLAVEEAAAAILRDLQH
jgi:hypothetical protein